MAKRHGYRDLNEVIAAGEALKAGDKPRKEALSMLLSALKAAFIDKRADLTEDEENAIVYREIKEAQETMDATPKDRTDIIDECRLKIAVYSDFAPQRMGDDEIRAVIADVLKELDIAAPTAKDKGRIMPGFLADFTVLDTDIFTCDPMAIRGILPTMTIMDGDVVFER